MAITTDGGLKQWLDAYYPASKYAGLAWADRPTIPYDEDQSLIEQLAVCAYGYFFNTEPHAEHSVDVKIIVMDAFPDARGSRINASQVYALDRWTEAYGYE